MESLAKVAIYQLKVGKVSVTGHNINIVTIGHHQDSGPYQPEKWWRGKWQTRDGGIITVLLCTMRDFNGIRSVTTWSHRRSWTFSIIKCPNSITHERRKSHNNCMFCFRDVRAIPLISASRWLVRRGDCTRLTWKENGEKLTFGRRVHKQSLALFLLTDMLVVTKKKGEERFLVLDYSSRNMVQVKKLFISGSWM